MIVSRVCAFLLGVSVITACQDSPTEPQLRPSATIDIAIEPDPTLVTFNSATCSLSNAATGVVSCSWNISNPAEHPLNMWAQAILIATYNCVNPHNGRIASTEQRELETLYQTFAVGPTLSGTNVALPPPFLQVNGRGRDKKNNACKGNGVVTALSYQLAYWDVSVITTSGTLRFSCRASDNRLGCFTS